MCILAGYLRLGGKRGREMKDHIEIIIVKGFDLVNQVPLGMLGRHRLDALGQRGQVRGDDPISAHLRQPLNKSLTNLTTRTRHQHKLFGHRVSLYPNKKLFEYYVLHRTALISIHTSESNPTSGTIKNGFTT